MSAHYFISDAHIGAHKRRAEERLTHFLESIRGRADSLFILGDLFDFWFEYDSAIPKHGFRVLAQLSELVDTGTRLGYLKGNHDFWFRGFLKREFGTEAVDELTTTLDGLRVYMAHGDAVDRGPAARLLRRVMRSRFNTMAYSLLHPDLGIGIAQRVAGISRRIGAKLYLREDLAEFAAAKLARGCDLVVMGHVHTPELRRMGRGTYISTGDWLTHFTYGIVRDGVPALEHFGDGGAPA